MTRKERLHKIVFESDTRAGRLFDITLLWIILLSVFIVMLGSIPEISRDFYHFFYWTEWLLTIIFTIEYFLRILISTKKLAYIFSFWGIVDLLSILPTYVSLFEAGYHSLLVIRIFRLLRIFRILKLVRFSSEAQMLGQALRASARKISIFLMAIIAIVVFMGTLMYVVEGAESGFTSIPQGVYWAIVTVTTVGYGDLVPQTILGKFISAFVMILGYSIIAVPTGIVTAAMTRSPEPTIECKECHNICAIDSKYCRRCGNKLS